MRMSEKQSNPIPVVDVIIEQESTVLFAKRKKEPFKGCPGLPGGFVNIGETIEEAARREVKEETSLDIELTDILVSIPILKEIQEDISFQLYS
jgi:8-oxo-dGTP diphosphatase